MKYDNNDNAIGNIGGIWEKVSGNHEETGGYYFLLKATLGGENFTMVAFKNKNYVEGGSSPMYFIFPYKPKIKNNTEEYNK